MHRRAPLLLILSSLLLMGADCNVKFSSGHHDDSDHEKRKAKKHDRDKRDRVDDPTVIVDIDIEVDGDSSAVVAFGIAAEEAPTAPAIPEPGAALLFLSGAAILARAERARLRAYRASRSRRASRRSRGRATR